MKRVLLCAVILAACGGSKSSPPANTSKAGSATTGSATASEDCMGGGVLKTEAATTSCKFFGEVMGPPPDAGTGIHMIKCCYATAEAACKNTGGCELKDCTFDAKATAPAPVTCKDTTHGGVPTNP